MLFITAVLLFVRRLRRIHLASALAASVLLTACGGGDSSADKERAQAAAKPSNDAEAYRFLQQATFGPTPTQAARLKEVGYSQWIDEQLDAPVARSHLQTVEASAAALNRAGSANANDVVYSWWTHAVRDDGAQLRHRLAFALSEIFVVSTNTIGNGRTVASYLDMLTDRSSGTAGPTTYRSLLEGVALHPAMGQYLSHLGNVKADGTGRVPDENFAREVMQLFSIGLYELDDSGQPRLVNGKPLESYTANDIKGLARVFTGFSWVTPASKAGVPWWKCFWRSAECLDPVVQEVTPMQGYGPNHEPGAKQFLRSTVQPQPTNAADPGASLRLALNALADHQNTAPFISRQLIQRLVTSNPSNAYVSDITQVFRQSGGNLRSVVKAILLHDEARRPNPSGMSTYGKLREPLLRMAHLLRAVPHSSERFNSSGGVFYGAIDTSDPASSLGQTPMRAPSVFNFFRPGFRPPQSAIAAAGLVAPEAQIATETTALSYANFLSGILESGWGEWNGTTRRNDVVFDYSPWMAKASAPAELIDVIANRLVGQPLDRSARTAAITAIESMPQLTDANKRQRVQAAILLVAVSPNFMVQQ